MSYKFCGNCEYCSDVKRKVLGIDVCLSPDVFKLELPLGCYRECAHYKRNVNNEMDKILR